MADETLRDWETIQQNANDKTERLMVTGGYLYRVITTSGAIAIVYVPTR